MNKTHIYIFLAVLALIVGIVFYLKPSLAQIKENTIKELTKFSELQFIFA